MRPCFAPQILNPPKTIPDPEAPCSLVLIEGALCRMNRKGRAVVRRTPVGTAIVQFLVTTGGALVLREEAAGFLPGFSNLYCLDAEMRLLWFAELPGPEDFFAEPVREAEGVFACTSISGVECRLDPATGRIVGRTSRARAAGSAAGA